MSNVWRWALFLSEFPYVIERVAGRSNVFADILTKLTQGYRSDKRTMKTISCLLCTAIQVIPTADQVTWSDLNITTKPQGAAKSCLFGCSLILEAQVWEKQGSIWVPENELDVQSNILVAFHCGTITLRGIEATGSTLRENFFWKSMDRGAERLVKGCLCCLITGSRDIVPRSIAFDLHGVIPNEVIHFDFLYIGKSQDGKCYVLIIIDKN